MHAPDGYCTPWEESCTSQNYHLNLQQTLLRAHAAYMAHHIAEHVGEHPVNGESTSRSGTLLPRKDLAAALRRGGGSDAEWVDIQSSVGFAQESRENREGVPQWQPFKLPARTWLTLKLQVDS
eukprot:1000976-Pelagomonas_calceolata.AAC.5